ncbi:GTPase IMAP family member 8-like [Danio aesculapii]|uniref:GTPase IMAP family member 8-like n=1 Tax=Danio aesculapii TaxID=1142201 RepID=UPI0024C063BF|nr:GTPase IMAP family member 8-like [Danio aesculapii]
MAQSKDTIIAGERHSPDWTRPNMGTSSDDDLPESPGIKAKEKPPKTNLHLNVVLLGRKGAGKSSSGNTILGRQAFIKAHSKESTSAFHVDVEPGIVYGLPITVYDTPGFTGRENQEEILKYDEVLRKCESGLCAFLLVLPSDKFTKEDQETVRKIEELLTERRPDNTWIVFTRGDELEKKNKTLNEFINDTRSLKNLVEKFGRFHVFNNNTNKSSDQVKSLISKVVQNILKNMAKQKQQKMAVNVQDVPVSDLPPMRIVLLGKTGTEKSTAGNTIVGETVVTQECSVKHTTVSGKSVSVIETPGLFDKQIDPVEVMVEMGRSVYLSSPGPHAFLIVFPVDITIIKEDQQILQITEVMFGEKALKYSIILLTHGEQMTKSVEDLCEENKALRHLIDQCGGRFHVFDDKNQGNIGQVNYLVQKIDTMVQKNGGGHYSNEMFDVHVAAVAEVQVGVGVGAVFSTAAARVGAAFSAVARAGAAVAQAALDVLNAANEGAEAGAGVAEHA